MTVTFDSLKKALAEAFDESAAKIDRVHGACWEARAEAVRNLVSIGAAILAGTIAFLGDSLPSRCSIGILALLSCWLLMGISVVSGILTLWQSITLRSFYPKLFNGRPALEERLRAVDLRAEDAMKSSDAIISAALKAVLDPMNRADRTAQICSRTCLVTFILSVAALVVFGVWKIASVA